MKEIRCVDPEQRDSMISAINAQVKRASSRYDSDKRCWWVKAVPVWEDIDDRRQAREQ